jgi:hypothetical protein
MATSTSPRASPSSHSHTNAPAQLSLPLLLQDNGDQYTPHCDGECHGGRWREGKRIATGLVYCEAPEQGGKTLFTKSGLKVRTPPFFCWFEGEREGEGRVLRGA